MKEVVAVIQMDKVESTKDALAIIGVPSFTAYKAYGRGAQRGLRIAYPSDSEVPYERTMRYLPKRMLSIVVDDEFVPAVVAVITKVNKTGNIGDGRIFVSPVEESIRIRTGERGREALL
jgi:nitrogen regulatory protein PII 2